MNAVRIFVAFAMVVSLAPRAHAQPAINDNFIAVTPSTGDRATLLQLLDQGAVLVAGSGPESAKVYEWFSGGRRRVDFTNPDSSKEQVYQFAPGSQPVSCDPSIALPAATGNGIQYSYSSSSGTCAKAALSVAYPTTGLFDNLQGSTQNGTCSYEGRSGSLWVVSPAYSVCASGNTPLVSHWDQLGVDLGYSTFTPGIPAPSNFCVPAACGCGNGIVDAGEDCDDGNNADGDCCSSTCKYEALSSPCGSDGVACTNDVCDASGTCQHQPSNADCDDADACTTDICDVATGCTHGHTPVATCSYDQPGMSQLVIQSNSDPARTKVQFKWAKGSFPYSALGNPTRTTEFSLCVYDANGSVASLAAPAGTSLCGKIPCWQLTGSTPSGIRYKDGSKPPMNDGIKTITAKAATDGKALLQLGAQGATIPSVSLGGGLAYPVTAQIVTPDAGCWQADFAQVDEKKNDGATFKAVHKQP